MADPFPDLPGVFSDTFGQDVTHIDANAQSTDLKAIFRNRPETSLEMVQPGPMVHLPKDSGVSPATGDRFLIGQDDYTVKSVESDGFGMEICILQRT